MYIYKINKDENKEEDKPNGANVKSTELVYASLSVYSYFLAVLILILS